MTRVSIESERLRGAEKAMSPVYQSHDAVKKKFRTAAEEAPFMIRTLGFGSGIATLAAKEDERLKLAAMLAQWLLWNCPYSTYTPADARPDQPPTWETELRNVNRNRGAQQIEEIVAQEWVKKLLNAVAAAGRPQYRAGQIEALGYAGWIKRLAQAFCPK